MNQLKIIIVEDELIPAEFLKVIVEESGAEVIDIIDTGKEAIKQCIQKVPDVIFMDVMLSDNISGCEAAVAISRKNTQSKIVFLTAYMDEEMIEYAASSGAVNYLTKPYNKSQILATLQLLSTQKKPCKPLVIHNKVKDERIYLINNYVYLRKENRLLKDNKEVALGRTGMKLLEILCKQVNISISTSQISMYVWGEEVNDKTFRSLMYRMRQATDTELIKNISGTGYMICSE